MFPFYTYWKRFGKFLKKQLYWSHSLVWNFSKKETPVYVCFQWIVWNFAEQLFYGLSLDDCIVFIARFLNWFHYCEKFCRTSSLIPLLCKILRNIDFQIGSIIVQSFAEQFFCGLSLDDCIVFIAGAFLRLSKSDCIAFVAWFLIWFHY